MLSSSESDADRRGQKPGVRGLLILDVDGVVFRGHLLVELARRQGVGELLRTLWAASLFEVGRISLEDFLRRCYRRLRGVAWDALWQTYRGMALHANVRETVRGFHRAGWRVALLTSGVPQPIVKDLAWRMGADDGVGIDVPVQRGALTGEVRGEMVTTGGKLHCAERLMGVAGVTWECVMAVGDDRNNLPLLRRAGTSVGFRATSTVRREARLLVESGDLGALLPLMDAGRASGTRALRAGRRFWHREILRKMLHLTGAAVPLLYRVSATGTMLLLAAAIAAYLLFEVCRVNGVVVPILHRLSRVVIRRHERRHIAVGPLTLALGILVALACVPPRIGLPCVLIAVVADSLAAVIGERWGRLRWPYNRRKSVQGSAAFFVAAFLCAGAYVPLTQAAFMAGVGALIESLPVDDWDNFLTPVGTAVIAGAVAAAMG